MFRRIRALLESQDCQWILAAAFGIVLFVVSFQDIIGSVIMIDRHGNKLGVATCAVCGKLPPVAEHRCAACLQREGRLDDQTAQLGHLLTTSRSDENSPSGSMD